jgi:pimeloyl-ACP methyl ester carboxylesterase
MLTARRGRGISKRIGRTAAGKGAAALERLVGEVQKLPREVWPAIQSHWSEPKSFLAMAAYLECLPECASEVLGMSVPHDIPMVILSAGNAVRQELEEREELIKDRPNARHIVLEGAGHWLQLERPGEVVSAVRGLARADRATVSRSR